MKVIAIVAASLNNVIGVNGRLPWKAPSDLARFQKETMGHHVIMGRKTWESIPASGVPGVKLPGRMAHVITRNRKLLNKSPAVYGCNGLWTSLSNAVERLIAEGKTVFIAGGSEIFEEAFELDLIDEVWLTRIETTVYPQVGETLAYFPSQYTQGWPLWCESLRTEEGELIQVFERYENPKHSKKEEPKMSEVNKELEAANAAITKQKQRQLLAMVVDAYQSNGQICYDLASLCADELGLRIDERPPQTGEAESPSPLAAAAGVATAVGEQLKTALKTALKVSGGVMKIENLTINIS